MNHPLILNKVFSSRKNIILMGIVLAMVFVGSSLALSSKAFAAGGVGGGGSSSGGAGGHQTRDGHSWMVYDVNGPGPTDGFRNGASWGAVQDTCQSANAGSIMIYGVADGNQDIMGYNFTSSWEAFAGHYAPGTSVDHGRATAIPTSWAQTAFNELPSRGVSTFGFTFGVNVSWFCSEINQTNHDPAGQALADCNAGFQGWALDADNLFAQLGIGIAIKHAGAATWDPSLTVYTTGNQPIPNPPFNTVALAAYGVGGDRGYTTPIPSQLKDGSTYEWIALAANATGTPGNGFGFSSIGTGTFTCPAEWDVGVDVVCDIDSGTAIFTFSRNGNIAGDVTVTRNVRLNDPTQVILSNETTVYNNTNWPTGSIEVSSNPAVGQTMDASISVSPGGSGSLSNSGNDSRACPTTGPHSAKPYFRVYGGDVVVGRNFTSGGTCTGSTSAEIKSFAQHPSSGWRGSGTELAARATGAIDGFLSASTRPGSPSAPAGLSFGNSTGVGSTPIANFGAIKPGNDSAAYAGCIPDYYSEYIDGKFPDQATIDEHNLANSASKVGDASGSGEWSSNGVIDVAKSGYYFYEGDLTITDNVILDDYNFDGSAAGADMAQIPKFVLIVRGNIYIAPNVTELQGVYIAQPGPGGGGTINTCAGAGHTWEECRDNQLVVQGSFISSDLKLNRLKGDINNANPGEGPGASEIAEVFIFRPDLMFSKAGDEAHDPTTRPTEYDSIVGLPPVL